MFVKTQFDTIINLAEFEKIKVEWSVKSPNSKNVHNTISAVSEGKCEILAQFKENMADETGNAYQDLFSALLAGDTAFDMTHYLSAIAHNPL